jgi:hypothetical protein
VNRQLLLELQQFINNNKMVVEKNVKFGTQHLESYQEKKKDIDDFIEENKDDPFVKKLFHYIDQSGKKDSEIYNKAGIDRRLFSKIRSNEDYHLSKNNVIALCLALELKLKEAKELLGTCGYSLSNSSNFDLIIVFFINKEIYDLDVINEALYKFNFKPIGVTL